MRCFDDIRRHKLADACEKFSFFFPFSGGKGHQGSSVARGKQRGNVATLNRADSVCMRMCGYVVWRRGRLAHLKFFDWRPVLQEINLETD